MYARFESDIAAMNSRYGLPNINVSVWSDVVARLEQFKDILDKECAEITDIQVLADQADDHNWGQEGSDQYILPVKVVVALADLLSDIIVYCSSEGQRWGIPLPLITAIVMASNTSKLGEDGKPIINPVNGKFEKGPNYWKPEAAIEYALTHEDAADNIVFKMDPAGRVEVSFLTTEQRLEIEKQLREQQDARALKSMEANAPKENTDGAYIEENQAEQTQGNENDAK